MYELNRSYTPRKSFVQILLLPMPFRAFISPAICGSGCVQKHDRNCGKNICFGRSRKHLLSADSKGRARVTAHLMWPGDTCVSLTLRSTSKEGLFVLLYTWETWFPRGKGKLVGAVCLSSTALGTCWCDYPLHWQGLVHRQGMDGTLAVSGGVAWCWSLCWSVLDGACFLWVCSQPQLNGVWTSLNNTKVFDFAQSCSQSCDSPQRNA